MRPRIISPSRLGTVRLSMLYPLVNGSTVLNRRGQERVLTPSGQLQAPRPILSRQSPGGGGTCIGVSNCVYQEVP